MSNFFDNNIGLIDDSPLINVDESEIVRVNTKFYRYNVSGYYYHYLIVSETLICSNNSIINYDII